MTITNYAVKYSGAVDEKFAAESKSDLCVNKDYDFVGAKTVKIYNIATSAMNNYSRTGIARYGTVEDLNVTEQEMTMTRDRSFTFAIDKMDEDETNGALNAGKALARQLREVVIPEVDAYRYAKLATAAGTKATPAALTADNIYTAITAGTEVLDDNSVPMVGRFLIVPPATYNLIKNAKGFALDTEIAQEMKIKGVVAEIDGMQVVKVPSSMLPTKAGFIIGHSVACTAPVKLAEYKINDEPQGISGSLVEGRIYYDAFVLANKAKAIYYHATV